MLKRSHKAFVLTVAILGSRAGTARAQYATGNPQGDIGVKISETSTLHVGVAAEAGYDTNVFYNDDQRQDSAMLRVIPSIALTNAGRDGVAHSGVVYNLGANLVYREYLNADENIRAQRAFIPTVLGSLSIPGVKSTVTLTDQFTRNEDAPYVPGGSPIIRDVNQGSLNLSFSPGGGRITGTVRYTNVLDFYETQEYKYASNMAHDLLLDASWKWLPKTALFLQTSVGYIQFIETGAASPGGDTRENSWPVQAMTGLRGLITPKTSLNLGLGYATAFYESSSLNPSGLSNLSATVSVGYMPTLTSRLTLGYFHGFRNSAVIGNFYDVDRGTLNLSYSVGHLVAGAMGTYEYRRYQNFGAKAPIPFSAPRRDHVLIGTAGLDYYIQKWFYAGVSYAVTLDHPTVDSAVPAIQATAVTYTKQQILARIGVAY